MSEHELHCFAESGNCYKVALMLNLCGCSWRPVWVDYFGGETRTDRYKAEVNAQGEVPVLAHRGRRLTQSGLILSYLCETTGRFGGRDEDERREVLRWLLFDNHKFTSYYASLRWLVGIEQSGHPEVVRFLRGRALSAMRVVEQHLSARAFIVGGEPTIADISMVGYQFYEEETTLDRRAFPAILAWRARIAALPGWRHPYDLLPRGA